MPIVLDPDIAISSDPFDQLRSAYALSLKCRRRARAGDDVPDLTQMYGWWGDTYPDVEGDEWGSRWWTLQGRPISVALLEGPGIVKEALQWAIDDKHVIENRVSVEALASNMVGVLVSGVLPSGEVVAILNPWYGLI